MIDSGLPYLSAQAHMSLRDLFPPYVAPPLKKTGADPHGPRAGVATWDLALRCGSTVPWLPGQINCVASEVRA